MSRTLKVSFRAILVSIALAVCSGTCLAAGNLMSATTAEEQQEQSWYREQASTNPDVTAIVQQKAAIRAEQRMSRMASMQWYGMSNSRPQGAVTPFTSRYSPVWEMPGGKPYSWYPQARPGYVMYWR
jgi:PhoPQ-activated pathogenicity-related protein